MAALPSSTITVLDPGLGIVGAASNRAVIMGTASSGPTDQFTLLGTQDDLTSTFSEGPAVDTASLVMATGGGPIGFIRMQTSIAASNEAVVQDGPGGAVTVAGSALVDSLIRVEIIAGGALGVATFRYSLDYGAVTTDEVPTFSPVQTVPAGGSYVIPTIGITLSFDGPGDYTAGTIYTVQVNCAASNSTDLSAAMTALNATPLAWRYVVLQTSENTGDSTAHAALAVSLQSSLATFATNNKYRRGMMPANVDGADPISDYAGVAADRLLIAYGLAQYVSPKPFIGYARPKLPALNSFAMRAAGSLISTDLKRVTGNGINDGGPLPNVLAIYQDERTTPSGSDDINLSTLRTYEGRPGSYITQGRLKGPAGSDFTLWPRGLVMDVACETAQAIQENWIGRSVRVNDGGTIDERDALRFEAEMNAALNAALLAPRNAEGTDGHISDFRYQIDRTNNVLTTSTVQATLSIRPLGYVDYITTTVSFVVSLGPTNTAVEA